MKKIMILAGGTSTAWHIVDTLKKNYDSEIYLIICDINPSYLIHTSVFADRYYTVPPIDSPVYYETMIELFHKERVDILIPLIDKDILLFCEDNLDLINLEIRSVAPQRKTAEILSNKERMEPFLNQIGIVTPKVFRKNDELIPNQKYFMKDRVGFGSRGVQCILGKDAPSINKQHVIQELCHAPELSVDVIRADDRVYTVCRQRIETKLGVSTKCRVFFDLEIQQVLETISANIRLPVMNCVQFMKNDQGQWSLTDFNLRSGGGTAISAAIGFEAVRFAAAGWLGRKPDPSCLRVPENEKYVVRTYQEVVTQE